MKMCFFLELFLLGEALVAEVQNAFHFYLARLDQLALPRIEPHDDHGTECFDVLLGPRHFASRRAPPCWCLLHLQVNRADFLAC